MQTIFACGGVTPLTFLAVSVFVVAGCQQSPVSTDADASAKRLPVVRLVSAERTTIQRTTTQPATIEAWHHAEIHARVSGYLTELKVDIGEPVSAGDILAVISVPEMERTQEKQQAEIRRLEAEHRRALVSVQLAQAGVRSAEASEQEAVADVQQATAGLNADTAEFKRVSELVEQRAVAARLLDEAKQRFEASQSALKATEAALESSRAAVTVAREQAAVAQAEASAAEAAIEVARKQVEETTTMIQYATLRAPFDGVVTRRNVDPGDLVSGPVPGSSGSGKPLFEVSQVDTVRVRVAVPENEAPLISIGSDVSLRLRSLPAQDFSGRVSRISRRLDEATRTMLVEVDLRNGEGLLIPGMYGEATVSLRETPDALMLAATAVRHDEAGNSSVYVVDESGSIRVVAVSTGYDDGRQMEILSGLNESDRVAAGRIGRFTEGQKVEIR